MQEQVRVYYGSIREVRVGDKVWVHPNMEVGRYGVREGTVREVDRSRVSVRMGNCGPILSFPPKVLAPDVSARTYSR